MPMNNRMQITRPEASDPAVGAILIDYSVGNQVLGLGVTQTARGIHCNTAGNLAVVMQDGSVATFALTAGVTYPYAIRQVTQTGSTAAGVVLL